MKRVNGWWIVGAVAAAAMLGMARPATVAGADDTVAQSLSVLEEKVDRLRAQVEDLQFRNQKQQQQIEDLQSQITQIRKSSGGASADDIAQLQAQIKAVDAARERDRQVIVDQVARELAAISGGSRTGSKPPKPGGSSNFTNTGGGAEHVVQKGETLTTIARAYGVGIEDLKKANQLTNPNDLKVGQKLVIPKKTE
jgi:LysM repeat protein